MYYSFVFCQQCNDFITLKEYPSEPPQWVEYSFCPDCINKLKEMEGGER